MKKSYPIRILLLILIFTFSPMILGENSEHVSLSNLPHYYPDYFENSAVLTGIDKKITD